MKTPRISTRIIALFVCLTLAISPAVTALAESLPDEDMIIFEEDIQASEGSEADEEMMIIEESSEEGEIFFEEDESLTSLPEEEGIFYEEQDEETDEMVRSSAGGTIEISLDMNYNQSSARAMLEYINKFRAGEDVDGQSASYINSDNTTYTDLTGQLQPLTYDYELERIAMQRAAEVAVSNSHTRPDGTTCFTAWTDGWQACGENIACGYNSNTTTKEAFVSWREDDEDYSGQGHRRNMLNTSFNRIGIAHVKYKGVDYWTQAFGYGSGDDSATAAVDENKTVSVTVLETGMLNLNLSCNKESYTLEVNESDVVPDVTAEFRMENTWPNIEGFIVQRITGSIPAEWISEDPAVAVVADGVVTAIAEGTTNINTSLNGMYISVPVMVNANDPGTDNHLKAWVADENYNENDNGINYYVKPHESKTLSVAVSADDTSGITYQWNYRGSVIEESRENTINTGEITEEGYYCCTVRDRYGNKKSVFFWIWIDNNFDAFVEGDDTIYLSPNASAVISVTVTANDTSKISYQWYELEEQESNEYYVPSIEREIEGAEESVFEIPEATKSTIYYCLVSDGYSNNEIRKVYFHIIIENHLTAYVHDAIDSWTKMIVKAGDNIELKVDVSADDMKEITYLWFKSVRNEDGSSDWVFIADDATYNLKNDKESTVYVCKVKDGYGNYANVSFTVFFDDTVELLPDIENCVTIETAGEGKRFSFVPEESGLYVLTANTDEIYVDLYDSEMNCISNTKRDGTFKYFEMYLDAGQAYYLYIHYNTYYYYKTDTFIVRVNHTINNYLDVWVQDENTYRHNNSICYYIEPDDSLTLSVSVSANDISGIIYRWYEDNTLVQESQEPVFITGVISAPIRYTCCVEDGFGNVRYVEFYVHFKSNGQESGNPLPLNLYSRATLELSQMDFVELLNQYADPKDFSTLGTPAYPGYNYGVTVEQMAEIQEKVDEITEGLTDPYEKAEALYAWITSNMYYNYCLDDWPECEGNDRIYWTYSHLRGVCGHFAMLVNTMMQMAGVPCIVIHSEHSHSINAIHFNGSWHLIDATWDCPNLYWSEDNKVFIGEGKRNFFCNEKDWDFMYGHDCLYVDYSWHSITENTIYDSDKFQIYVNGTYVPNETITIPYTAEEPVLNIELYYNGNKLEYRKDYTYGKSVSESFAAIGEHSINIEGCGAFYFTRNFTVRVVDDENRDLSLHGRVEQNCIGVFSVYCGDIQISRIDENGPFGYYLEKDGEGRTWVVGTEDYYGRIEVPEVTHDWNEGRVTKEPTCTEKGIKTYSCRNNTSHQYTEEIPPLGHTPAEAVREYEIAASCTKEGSYDEVVYCSVCHEELSRTKKTVDKIAHTPIAIPAVAATCTETGLTEGSKCSVCGEILTAQEVISALGHDYRSVVTAPTCEDEGFTTYTCSRCNDSYVADYVDALGHDYVGTVTKEATCAEEGIRTYTCTHDSTHTYTETIPKLAHTPAEAVKENEIAATCAKEGRYDEVIYCSVCHEELSRTKKTVDKIAHTPTVIPAVTATCTQDGLTEGSRCSVCGEILKAQEAIEAPGHTWDEGVVTTKPTKEKDGVKTFTCTICRETKTEAVPYVPVTKIALDKTTADVATGSSIQLTVTIEPENATDPAITWKSSNTGLVTVDAEGNVSAKKYGKAEITASTADGAKAVCEIQTRFKDVNDPGRSFYEAVYWAVDNGITKCTVTFNPDNNVTRSEFVAFLYRLAGQPKVTSKTTKFSDVNKNTKFYKEISWAVSKGIINGYKDGTFRPDDPVTRSQAATMIWRWAGKPKAKQTKNPFSDIKTSGDAYKAILWGSENGIIKGSKGKFLPNDPCTRANTVTFMYRYRQKFN